MDDRVVLAVDEVAERVPDGAGLEQTRRELVQQRLEGVVVVLVHEHDLDVGLGELVRGADACEPSTENDDARSPGLTVHIAPAPIGFGDPAGDATCPPQWPTSPLVDEEQKAQRRYKDRRMTWSASFRLRRSLKESLWVLPLAAGAVGALLGDTGGRLEDAVDVPSSWEYSAATSTSVLTAIVGSMVALTGFALTVSVLGVQMATGTFSARYMRILYRDPLLKWLLAVLVGTTTYSFALLRHVDADSVPDIGVTFAGGLVLVSLILFLLFLDRFLRRLRPVAVAALVAAMGKRALEGAVATAAARERPDVLPADYEPDGEPVRVVRSEGAGAIQAIDGRGLVRYAQANRCRLVLRHTVGDFVPGGAVLVEVYGEDPGDDAERRLRGMIALGIERTIEQDPAFAIRIMVDIAIRALSPAVNDPTTAVQVLDHLGDTLQLVGTTPVPDPSSRGGDGPAEVLVPVRDWDQFLSLGITEIREYGAPSVQVMRRLRALLEELRESVLPERRAAVDRELARLDATVQRSFGGTEDLDLAAAPDRQGIGGPAEADRLRNLRDD